MLQRVSLVSMINESYIFNTGVLLTENDLNILFDGLLPIKRTNVVCTGGESLLSDCSFNGVDGDPNCTHQNDVIVVCAGKQME